MQNIIPDHCLLLKAGFIGKTSLPNSAKDLDLFGERYSNFITKSFENKQPSIQAIFNLLLNQKEKANVRKLMDPKNLNNDEYAYIYIHLCLLQELKDYQTCNRISSLELKAVRINETIYKFYYKYAFLELINDDLDKLRSSNNNIKERITDWVNYKNLLIYEDKNNSKVNTPNYKQISIETLSNYMDNGLYLDFENVTLSIGFERLEEDIKVKFIKPRVGHKVNDIYQIEPRAKTKEDILYIITNIERRKNNILLINELLQEYLVIKYKAESNPNNNELNLLAQKLKLELSYLGVTTYKGDLLTKFNNKLTILTKRKKQVLEIQKKLNISSLKSYTLLENTPFAVTLFEVTPGLTVTEEDKDKLAAQKDKLVELWLSSTNNAIYVYEQSKGLPIYKSESRLSTVKELLSAVEEAYWVEGVAYDNVTGIYLFNKDSDREQYPNKAFIRLNVNS